MRVPLCWIFICCSLQTSEFGAILAQWYPEQHHLPSVTLLSLSQCSCCALGLRLWSHTSGRSGCLLTNLRRNLHRQQVTAAVGLVLLLGTDWQAASAQTCACVCYTIQQRNLDLPQKIAIKLYREISAEFGGMMSRKECFSDLLSLLWLWCCWIQFAYWKLKGHSDPPLT